MRGRLVLIAERYGTPRVLVTNAVRSLGYPAKAGATGADALAFLTLHPDGVQCLLADVGLPDMDGRELAARALAIAPGLRVVLMVAPGDDAVQRPFPGFGGVPCVAKPVFRDRLAAMLGEPGRSLAASATGISVRGAGGACGCSMLLHDAAGSASLAAAVRASATTRITSLPRIASPGGRGNSGAGRGARTGWSRGGNPSGCGGRQSPAWCSRAARRARRPIG